MLAGKEHYKNFTKKVRIKPVDIPEPTNKQKNT